MQREQDRIKELISAINELDEEERDRLRVGMQTGLYAAGSEGYR